MLLYHNASPIVIGLVSYLHAAHRPAVANTCFFRVADSTSGVMRSGRNASSTYVTPIASKRGPIRRLSKSVLCVSKKRACLKGIHVGDGSRPCIPVVEVSHPSKLPSRALAPTAAPRRTVTLIPYRHHKQISRPSNLSRVDNRLQTIHPVLEYPYSDKIARRPVVSHSSCCPSTYSVGSCRRTRHSAPVTSLPCRVGPGRLSRWCRCAGGWGWDGLRRALRGR